MTLGSRSKTEPTARPPEGRASVDPQAGGTTAPLTGADSRATCPGIENPLGDYGEQTGALFG